MADVRVQTLADALGVPAGVGATLRVQVYEGLFPAVRVAGELVTFPVEAQQVLTGSPGEVFALYTLPPNLYWRVTVHGASFAVVRNVILPAGSGPFDFADLVDVNPTTALPDPGSALADAFIAELEAIRDATIAIAVDDVSVAAQVESGPLTGAALAAQPVSTATQTALDLKQDESAMDASVAAQVTSGPLTGAALDAAYALLDEPQRMATRTDDLGDRLTKVGVVLSKGAAGSFDADMVESLFPFRDPLSGRFAGVYTGYSTVTSVQRSAIGLAYSDDGIQWFKEKTAILSGSGLSGDADEGGVTGPVCYYEDGTYYLFYIGLTSAGYEGGEKSICLATATSLTGPWTRLGAIIQHDATVPWRANAVWHISIVKHKGTYYAFFNANNDANQEVIGYATASALTGPWTSDDTNSPIIALGGSLTWEYQKQGDPSVRLRGDHYVMNYFGANAGVTHAADGIATTSYENFPLGWTKSASNPVLVPSETYDAKFAHKPCIMVHQGKVYHYYTSVDASNERTIALALSRDAPATSAIAAKDSFIRADNASLGAADTGQLWAISGGSGWAITGNKAAWTGSTDGAALLDSGLADDFEFSFVVHTLNGSYPFGAFVRWADASNYIKIYRAPGNVWAYSRNGVVTNFTGATTITAGDHIAIQVRHSSYAVLVNGTQQGEIVKVGTAATTTVQGLAGSGNLATQVSDYRVRALVG